MRLFLVVIEDGRSELDSVEAAEAWLRGLVEDPTSAIKVRIVRPGGLLALKVLEELPPVRHVNMGRPRS